MQESQVIKKPTICKAWILATRPKTLPVSFSPLLATTALIYQQGGSVRWLIILVVLLCSLCLQVGVNLINDALDFKKGADPKERLGPQRATQGGLLPFQTVLWGGISCLFLAFIFGIPLILAGGWLLVGILLLSIACAYLYTGGPFPLAYRGLGEVFIFIFFGLVNCFTLYFLQLEKIDLSVALLAMQMGLLAAVPCAINNLRDHVTDALVSKKTLAVRFGVTFGRLEIIFLSLFPFFLSSGWWLIGQKEMALLPFFTLPFVIKNLKAIESTPPSFHYNKFLAASVQSQLGFSILLSLGAVISPKAAKIIEHLWA